MSNALVASGMLVLPKIRQDNVCMMTAIDPSAITGVEPSTIRFKGKSFAGTKVYTKTGFFKVFANPTNVLLAQQAAKQNQLIAVDSLVALPEYTTATKSLKVLTA